MNLSNINWWPMALVLFGACHYVFRKYMLPVSERTINELNEKSFLGSLGYSPMGGLVTIGLGLIFFVLFNFL